MSSRCLGIVLLGGSLAVFTHAQTPTLGPELPISGYATTWANRSAMAADGAGNFVVAWNSYLRDGSEGGIFARRFDASGNALGSDFQVNTYTTGHQYGPSVAMSPDGSFLVVWHSPLQDGDELGVFAQRYDGAGNPLGSELQVNQHTERDQGRPSAAMKADGSFVVAWMHCCAGSNGIFARRFDPAGLPLGDDFQVSVYSGGFQDNPSVAMDAAGGFVVAWESFPQDGGAWGSFARRFDSNGQALGNEFQVNTHTTGAEVAPSVAVSPDGHFVVAWESYGQDGSSWGIFAQRYDDTGNPTGPEFQVNSYTSEGQIAPAVAMDGGGNFLVAWSSDGQDGDGWGTFAQRFSADGDRLGTEFEVNTYTTGWQINAAIAMTSFGEFVLSWGSWQPEGGGVIARRGGFPSASPLKVDERPSGGPSNVNGVLETGETVTVDPAYRNACDNALPIVGTASDLTGPVGPTYGIDDSSSDYGAIPSGATVDCFSASADCLEMTVSGARPAPHWDATFEEALSSGVTKTWTLHLGESFPDVPTSNPFYGLIENTFHNGITGGCGAGNYCPTSSVTRAQMAVFLLKARHGSTYLPPACAGTFADVTCPSLFADWIEQLFHEGITVGCGGNNYCPNNPVTRARMAAFLLKAKHGSAYVPPGCAGVFSDVACPSLFADWIERLAAEGITGGCGADNYCPNNPNTRGQMAVFLVKTFGLVLYGP